MASRMASDHTTNRSRDILASPWLAFLVFWLPAIVIAVTARGDFGNGLRTVVWTAALSIMGTACIANAIRYGRRHCYMTGPFLLAMAAVTLLYGLGVVPADRSGWSWIAGITLTGTIVLCCLPELFWEKYRNSRVTGGDQ